MPTAPPRACPRPYCGKLNCREHSTATPRKSTTARGYGYHWDVRRKRYLRSHPLCAECLRQGRTTAACIVDHVIPHRQDPVLYRDERNWQGLCRPCDDQKRPGDIQMPQAEWMRLRASFLLTGIPKT